MNTVTTHHVTRHSVAMHGVAAHQVARWSWVLTASLLAWSMSACSVLNPPATPPPAFFALDSAPTLTAPALNVQVPGPATASVPSASASASHPPTTSAARAPQLTLIINPPQAASGFDSQRMVYVRKAHQLEYFARNEWVDAPARMLGPLLVSAAQQTGAFAAVVLASGAASGDLRLSTELLQLQHNFQVSPSRVQVRLRVYLTHEKTRKVLAWQEFSAEAAAASDTPHGGVAAANVAVQQVLAQVARFLVERPQ